MISISSLSLLKNSTVQTSIAIVSVAMVVGLSLYVFPIFSYASGPATAVGCGGTVVAGVNCGAGEVVPVECDAGSMAYEYNEEQAYTCNQTGFYWSGHRGYCQADPSCSACVPSAACAANTCSTTTCSDSCGNSYAGTQNCTPPPTTCADLGQVGTFPACSNPPPVYSQASYTPPPYSQSTYAPGYSESTYAPPVGCGTPSATLKAAPTRVRSGQTSTLTLTATGVTTSCSITGPGVNTTVPASSCGVSQTLVTPAITSQVTYKVTCDSSVDIAKIIVNLVPKVVEF